MTGAEHMGEAENRLRASDYVWQETQDEIGAIGALREAQVAQVHATLAVASVLAELGAALEPLHVAVSS